MLGFLKSQLPMGYYAQVSAHDQGNISLLKVLLESVSVFAGVAKVTGHSLLRPMHETAVCWISPSSMEP